MAKKTRPLVSVLIKPAGPDCNLNCTYCFYLEKAGLFPETKRHRMSDEIQEEVIRQIMQQSGDSVSIAWQGGEPTLMGLDFYKRAVELEIKYGHGQVVGNGLQTNGTLINEDWGAFLQKYDWLVGLSLDGPEHIHDHYRSDITGKGTHKKVENNGLMLLQNGVATNVLATLTDYSVQFPVETYNYFKSLGFTWMQFIPIVETDKNDSSRAAPFSVTAEKYGEYLCQVFDLWLADFRNGEPTTHVRHFDSVFYTYVGMEPPECTLMRECGPYVAIEHNGNVYSCDFFVEPKWKLGNVMNNRLTDMLNSKRQLAFGAAKAVMPGECRKCPWLTKCYGGCTKDRIKDPGDNRKPRFCLSYKMFYAHADKILRLLAEDWKKKQIDLQEKERTGGTYNAFKDFLK